MHIASIGIDLGKTTFHLVALGRAQQDSALQEIHALAVAGLHRQPAGGVNRTGGMRGIALCGYSAARAGAPGATDHGAVCQALPKVEQERLHRWGSDRRSRNQAKHAVCADQDPGATRLSGHAPGAGSTRAASHRTDQRDSRLFVGAWYHLSGAAHSPAQKLPTVVEDAKQNLSPRLRWLLAWLWQEWKQMEIDIQTITEKIERISNENASCQRLRQIPGFGPLSLHRHRDCDRQRSCLPSRTRLRGLGWRRATAVL
jgi:transposase